METVKYNVIDALSAVPVDQLTGTADAIIRSRLDADVAMPATNRRYGTVVR